jgi:hypothetical protein
MAVKSTFARNGKSEVDAPKTIKVRTVAHEDAKSMRDSAKQMPNVRLTFKEGEARTVRFLHEPFNKRNPCIENCRLDGDIRAVKRWYVNVWDRDSKQVRLLKLTGAMVENLIIKYERRGTIMDRDYSITRTGEGTDTKYHIEAEEKEAFDQRNLKLIDIEGYLDQQAQSYYGGGRAMKARAEGIGDEDDDEDVEDVEEEDEDEEEAPPRKTVAKGKATTTKSRRVEPDEDEDDEEEESDEEEDEEAEEEERPARKPATARGRKAAAVVEEDDEDEDEEEEAPRRKTTKAPTRPASSAKRPLGSRR